MGIFKFSFWVVFVTLGEAGEVEELNAVGVKLKFM